MKKEKPILYALGFAIITIISCAVILLFGFIINKQMTKENSSVPTYKSENKAVFVIDAGHGGEDAGAIAQDGTLEKDLNLEIATLISDLLELNGNSIVMTRSSDTLLYDYYNDLDDYTGQKKVYDLKNRLKISEENENSIYVGIHMNKFSISKYNGLQVYYSDNNRLSLDIANAIKSNTRLYLQKDNKREIKKSNGSIYILDKISIPAVLIECGFLSNESELESLKNDDYQAKLALTVFSSLLGFANYEEGI